jgi:hypothetical protein
MGHVMKWLIIRKSCGEGSEKTAITQAFQAEKRPNATWAKEKEPSFTKKAATFEKIDARFEKNAATFEKQAATLQ